MLYIYFQLFLQLSIRKMIKETTPCSIDSLYEGCTLRELKNHQSNGKNIDLGQKLKELFRKLDEDDDQQDQGIEDYDVGGYHPVFIGQVLINRYVVIQKLGYGHFSTVWLCKDFKYKTYVAVKIQKSSPHYLTSALDEVEILQRIQQKSRSKQWANGKEESHVVGLLNAFIFKTYSGNHFCMVFEILSCNLLDIIHRYNYEGLPMDVCQEISKQVLQGLDFLHRVCGVIHTDIKPENVMVDLSQDELRQIVQNGQLVNGQLFSERIKVIRKALGLGTSYFQHESHHSLKHIQLEQRLKNQNLNKNQKKTIRKKLRKQIEIQSLGNIENNPEGGSTSQFNFRLQELFDISKGKITFKGSKKELKFPFKIKIADLGNACWKNHHFSSQIQTRNYRSPQVILGQTYNETSDIWSFGCMMYELITGDLLFYPSKEQCRSKSEDHLAQIQEITGMFHPHFIARSPHKKKYFGNDGRLKHFPNISPYPLNVLLQVKNQIQKEQADELAKFLLQTFIHEPELRISAQNALKLPWLTRKIPKIFKIEEKQYAKLKQKFEQSEEQFILDHQNTKQSSISEQPEFDKGFEMIDSEEIQTTTSIRLIDRSFTDLGYISYNEGISLCELDKQANYQFI